MFVQKNTILANLVFFRVQNGTQVLSGEGKTRKFASVLVRAKKKKIKALGCSATIY